MKDEFKGFIVAVIALVVLILAAMGFYQQKMEVKEYQMDVTMTGYVIFDKNGHTIGVIPYGECLTLDDIIDNDNL